MKDWRALPSRGGIIGLALLAAATVLLGLAIWFTWQSATALEIVQAVQSEDSSDPPELVTIPAGNNLGTFGLGLLVFGLTLVVLYLAYQTRRFFALRYSLDRNAITVDTGDRRQVIPLANIRQIVPAQTVLDQAAGRTAPRPTQPKPSPPAAATPAAAPRQRTLERLEETAPEPEPEEDLKETTAVQEKPAGPAYQMTQTAAADSSLDHLEKIDNISSVEFVEIEAGDARAPAANLETAPGGNSGSKAEEVEIRPADIQAIAIDFSAPDDRRQPGPEAGPEPEPADMNQPEEVETTATLRVKTRPFSSWPGFYTHQAQHPVLGPVQFYSTQPLAASLLVRTDSMTYAISPREQQQFISEYKLRRRLGAIEPVQEGVIKGKFLSHPLWHDRLGRGLILAAVAGNLLLYIFLLLRFEELKPVLRIHFNKFGQVDRTGDRGELLFLPFIGLLALFANTLLGAVIHLRERIPAYLLYASAILIQALTAIAVLVILAVS